MKEPIMSKAFKNRQPSAIRAAGIEFEKRNDGVIALNTHIGNVSLPAHPSIQKRMFDLKKESSPFKDGVIQYSSTIGFKETNDAFLNIISASGFDTSKLYAQITNGGSQAMGLIIYGTCESVLNGDRPLLLIDAAYTNYNAMAKPLGIRTVSVSRHLNENGKFAIPDISEIENIIKNENPGAMVVIPYDNPTGHFYSMDDMKELGKLCVENNMWMISDEAYRELHYNSSETTSLYGLTNNLVPGIEGRRIVIETASKVWNACGLRIGAMVTDNKAFNEKCVAENTKELCSPVIDQYLFGALAHESVENLKSWFETQRNYYKPMLTQLTTKIKEELPGIIVSSPDASIYSVVDVRNLVNDQFDAMDFVNYCASEGKVEINGEKYTLLVSPMAGFYNAKEGEVNPGNTQMRIAYVETPEKMALVPKVFAELFNQYKTK
ncbi:aminotransferase class I/II-fold pyridoxal phosphate-dependent enzyme [Candidatus Woesearchaeota archaeon]|nr:aminotransferase class I/II-fold pyridoxal phosphate-dependent enzyme [Candidatus Woesearchaeota archaeon]MCF7901243.1 aminotransferase class I/II-fold pyridoxal phosphate-dependent enzyme [Candidatus Woesearchaeota archaeon]MCF8012850.1 aminotransferase class I/II-fold pyridoxal phosphate-dependent enzyme [Candidatus Woesearchaeota archaeon]